MYSNNSFPFCLPLSKLYVIKKSPLIRGFLFMLKMDELSSHSKKIQLLVSYLNSQHLLIVKRYVKLGIVLGYFSSYLKNELLMYSSLITYIRCLIHLILQ